MNTCKDYLPQLIFPNDENAEYWVRYMKYTTFHLKQYQYKDIVKIKNNDICIDCGSCLGDTAIFMKNQGAKTIYCFEIDKRNIECLKKTVHLMNLENYIHIINKGVSDSKTCVHYQPQNNNFGAGRITKEILPESYEVEVITIDEFCKEKNIKPNFIKMDIEGAETSALLGAQETIKNYSPNLAICIYHSFQDRFNIPIMINNINPDYKMYIKKSHPKGEVVLFCTL